MSKLLLIDGNAILHRAYHAYPALTNPKGEVVNAVYGFFTMLFLVLQEQKPEYLAICFDRSAPTIRQTMYAGYHENRPRPADEFIFQINLVHELLEVMKVQVFEVDGYEGDDLVGTIATKAVDKGLSASSSEDARTVVDSSKTSRSLSESRLQTEVLSKEKAKTAFSSSEKENREPFEVIILTGDRDLLQLVNKHVRVLMPITGITKTVLFDEAAVEEKYGVKPSQFVDYKALIGDPSDGYPGVSGVGPKTASKLIQEYDTFENLYGHVNDLPEKVGLKLATDAEQAALAQKLARIITDVPIQFDLEKCALTNFDIKALRKSFKEHEFKSLLARLDSMFGKEEEQLGLL